MSSANQLNLSFKILILLIAAISFPLITKAQRLKQRRFAADTSFAKPDTVKPRKEKNYHPDSTHDPLKTMLKSAIMPGWGQLYNKKWWKVPLIYGGFAGFAVIITYNHRNYVQDLTIYHYYNEPNKVKASMPYYAYFKKLMNYGVTQSQIADAVDAFDRDFQLGILGTAALYTIQLVDAYIDAKFIHSFTMDDKLSIRITPGLLNRQMYTASLSTPVIPVLKLTLTL